MVILRKFNVVTQESVLAQDKQLLNVSNHFFKKIILLLLNHRQPPVLPLHVFSPVFIFIMLASSLFICSFSWLCATAFLSRLPKSTQLIRSIMHLQLAYISLLFVLVLFPLYQSPITPIAQFLPHICKLKQALNNSDPVNWSQLGSHCSSAILLFITCWLPIAFLTAAVPNVSALLKSLIPTLLPPLLAHNLTSYWENWNHPNLSLHNCPPLSLQKSVHLSLFAFPLVECFGFGGRQS